MFSLDDKFGYLNATLSVHRAEGIADGVFDNATAAHIDLKNNKAIMIHDSVYQIIRQME